MYNIYSVLLKKTKFEFSTENEASQILIVTADIFRLLGWTVPVWHDRKPGMCGVAPEVLGSDRGRSNCHLVIR